MNIRALRVNWLIVILLGFALPGVAETLGLGKISSFSGINEPFVGVIELKGISAAQLEKLKVSLASPAEFRQAGLNYSKHAASLRFTPSQSSSGKPIIRISSTEAITEPFLGIVLNIDSPSGFASKEYMVALEPEPSAFGTKNKLEPGNQQSSSPNSEEITNLEPQEVTAFPLRHGPIRTQGNLLAIAKSYSVRGASSSQIAMALYRYNQNAFIKGDINRLRAGATLEIPNRDAVFETTKGVADMELQHLIRGEPVVVSLPQIASQSSASPPANKPGSAPPQPLEDKTPLSGDRVASGGVRNDKQVAAVGVEDPKSSSRSISYPLVFGPVRPGESLLSVARQLTPKDATTSQTALALFKHNPKAFINGDIHKLRSGVKLTIPTAQSIFDLPPETAKQSYLAALRGQAIPPDVVQTAAAPRDDQFQNQPVASTSPTQPLAEVSDAKDKISPATTSTPVLITTAETPPVSDQTKDLPFGTSSGNPPTDLLSSPVKGHTPPLQPEAKQAQEPATSARSSETGRLVIATHSPTETPQQVLEQRQGQNLKGEGTSVATAPSVSAKVASSPTDTDIQREMLLVREAGESNHQEYLNLRTRVTELETQIASMQKLLVLSSDQINQLLVLVTRNSTLPSPQIIAENPSGQMSRSGLPQSESNVGLDFESTGVKILGFILLIAILGYYLYHWKQRRLHYPLPLATDPREPGPSLSVPESHSPASSRETGTALAQSEITAELPVDGSISPKTNMASSPWLPEDYAPVANQRGSTAKNFSLEGSSPPSPGQGPGQASPSSAESEKSTSFANKVTSESVEPVPYAPPPEQAPASVSAHPNSHWNVSTADSEEIEEKIDLSMAYIKTNRIESARELLRQVIIEGNSDQKAQARAILDRLA